MRVALLVVAAFGLAAAAPLTWYETSLPTTLHPLYGRSMVDRRASELIFDRIYYRSAVTHELRSRLVTDGVAVDEGRGWRMRMRDGLTWHDGQPVVAQDLCFTVSALLDPLTPSPVAQATRADLAGCTVEGNTVTVRFNRAVYNAPDRLAFPLLPAHRFASTELRPDDAFSSRPTGTGPMSAGLGRREVRYTARNTGAHTAQIGEGLLQEAGDPLILVRTLLSNGVHGAISIPPAYRSEVAASDEVGLKNYDLQSWWFIALNPQTLPTVPLREAIDAAIDRTRLRDLTLGYDPEDPSPPCAFISGPFVPSSPYANRSVPIRERADLALVGSRMATAGGKLIGGRWTVNGKPLTLRIGQHALLDLEARDLLSQIGNMLQGAGFDRTVERISNDTWQSEGLSGGLADRYDLLVGRWSFGHDERVDPLFETRRGDRGGLNLFNWSDAETDALIGRHRAAATDTQARDAYHALHAHLARVRPYAFLWKLDTKSAWRNEVRNNVISPYWYFTEFDGWTLP